MTDYHNSLEAFNNYFLTVGKNIIKNIWSNKQNHDTYNNSNYYLSNQPHKAKRIENIIRSLKAKGSHGYDGITTKILKISAPFISSPLSYIFSKSDIWNLPHMIKICHYQTNFQEWR
jgi:hypothetical protein